MNRIEFLRGQGGVPRTLAGEDHVSGFVMYIPDADLPTIAGDGGFSTDDRIKAISTIEAAVALGITASHAKWRVRVLHYHLSEIFRVNPGISLYVGLFTPATTTYDFEEIKTMQNYADGRIRQFAVYAPDTVYSSANITALQAVATSLETGMTPVSILFASTDDDYSDLPAISGTGNNNVSAVIAQDGDVLSRGYLLFTDAENTTDLSVTCIGLALGCVSLAKVNEAISWVQKFPSGLDTPALADGTLIKTIDKADLEALDTKRYLFLTKYPSYNGSYWNDSHTLDVATSDYAYIESQRTMDKAVRGIYAYLLPYLSGPIYIDPATGKMRGDTVSTLEDVAGKALETMEKAGELSGYAVDIDPDQNVLSSSEVEFVIRKVGVAVMRKAKVSISYTTSLT
jgi:hypothetical protein